jgi:hypothetical protein
MSIGYGCFGGQDYHLGKDFSRVICWVWLLPIYQMMALMDTGIVPVWNEQLL